MSSDSYVVARDGLEGIRECWMPGNYRKGIGPRPKRPFDTEEQAQAFADRSSWPQGPVYECGVCGFWHLSSPKRS